MSPLAVAEIGGTSVKIGFAARGVPLARTRTFPTAEIRTADPPVALAALLRAAAAEAGITPARVVTTVPGFLAADGDTVLHTANVPELDGVRLASRLAAALGLPVTLERDVVLQLLGESAAGAVRGAREVLAVYFGTGIGAAYLGAQGIFRGGGWALELGHLPLAAGNPPERLEDRASGAALAARAAARARPVAELFRSPDPALAAALDAVLWQQALAVAAAATLFSPRIILLGGGIPQMAGFPRDTLTQRIARSLPAPYRPHPPELRWARLGWKAAIHGALLLTEGKA
ncbi:ROK family protein [Amaricoccus sp.]|uniref:ROK family protein n=1 Tax=Amaricoccus sp. TaxID=1872485 RepID=UPI00262FB060|nr:ROK family protein [Amaricoccus sp.]HRO11209.1 ROK family protein [Amaricoccus sp.]